MRGLSWRALLLALLVVIVLALSACGPLADPQAQQWRATQPAESLSAGLSLSQTFVPSRDRFAALDVLLAVGSPADDVEGELWLVLREAGSDRQLAAAAAPFADLRHNQRYRLAFPPEVASAGRTYELTLSATSKASAPATVWLATDDAYPAGARSLDGAAAAGDLVFRAYYDYAPAALLADLVASLEARWLTFLLALALLFLPGLALRSFFLPWLTLDAAEEAGLALGLSLALAPLLLYFVSLAGGSVGGPLLGGLLLAAGVTWAMNWRRTRSGWFRRPQLSSSAWGAFAATAGALLLRFVHARDLVLPMWIDSVHHTLIARLIVESGRLPVDYGPLVPAQPFTYHFGFHTLVAYVCWLSGLEVAEGVLFVGQLLSGMAVLPAYLLASRLCADRRAGLVAGVLVGLVTTMPAYYVSWGRYPQLAGLLLLPAAIVVWRLDWPAAHTGAWRLVARPLLAALLAAGLVLVHPRVALLFGAWASVEAVAAAFVAWRVRRLPWRGAAARLAAILLAAVCLAPWLGRLALSPVVSTLAQAEENPADFPLALLSGGADGVVLAAAIGGAALGLARRRRAAFVLIGWLGVSLVVANPRWLGLPINPVLGSGALAIALFLPLSALASLLASELLATLRCDSWRPAIRFALGLALLGAGAVSGRQLVGIVNADCVLATAADVAALRWVERETSAQAAFLVNARFWQHNTYVGTDGGYWLTPLAGRRTMPPPVVYNQAADSAVRRVNQFAARLADPALDAETLARLMADEGLTHVFLGSWGGLLTPERLVGSAAFTPVYAQDGVWIFARRLR